MKQVRVNKCGNICEDGKYLVTLTGSYTFVHVVGMYKHEVHKCEPKLPISFIYSKELI